MQLQRLQLSRACLGVAPHACREILAGPLDDEARRGRITHEPDRVARDAEPDLDLGAHRYPLDERAERVSQETIALVAAVVADLPAEEARRDTEPDLLALAFAHSVH